MRRLSFPTLSVFICGAALAASGCSAPAGANPTPIAARPPNPNPPAAQAGGPTAAASVYRQNGVRVVNITSLGLVRTQQGVAARPQGIGSGFVYDSDGHIVTNNHVVQEADQLQVTFQDRTSTPAKLVGRDPDNDLAVVQVDPNAAPAGATQPVTLADSDSIRIGEAAVAIGSPLGLQQTVTEGVVSALRTPGEGSAEGSLDLLGGAVQTDAAINPGNSGGPLFNAGGEVIGVNTAILSQSGGAEGIGFAIPSNVVKRVVPVLIRSGHYTHPQIGIGGLPLAAIGPQTRQQLGIPAGQQGILVLEASGGAQQAGIQGGSRPVQVGGVQIPAGGDVIVAVDGHRVDSPGELRGYIENAAKQPNDTVTLTVVRNGKSQDIPVTLGERPPQTPAPAGR